MFSILLNFSLWKLLGLVGYRESEFFESSDINENLWIIRCKEITGNEFVNLIGKNIFNNLIREFFY